MAIRSEIPNGDVTHEGEAEGAVYAPLIEKCSQLLTSAELELPNTHKVNLVFSTPGLWESPLGIVQVEGVTCFNAMVLQHPDGSRITVSETTRSEESVNEFGVDGRFLLFARHPFPAYNPRLVEKRALMLAGDEAHPCVMFVQESDQPDGRTTQELWNCFYLSDLRIQPEDVGAVSSMLDELAQIRPVLHEGVAAYLGSFDSIVPGMKERVLSALQKEGFTAADFVKDTLAWLEGTPAPVTSYDFEPETQQLLRSIAENDIDEPNVQYLQWQLLSLPENGFPLLPV